MKPVGWSVAGHVALGLLVFAIARFHWSRQAAAPLAVAPLQTVLVDAATLRRAQAPPPVEPAPQAKPESKPEPAPVKPANPMPKPQLRPAPAKPAMSAPKPPPAKPAKPAIPDMAAQDRLAAEAALEAQLAAEAGRQVAVAQGAQDEWNQRLRERIESKWYRPATARRGLRCRVAVTLVPGGTVASAVVEECNGDAAVRESLRSAVMSASPLPLPKDPRMFERKLVLEFTPDD